MNFLQQNSFEDRLRSSISIAWDIFMHKVAYGAIEINKEASMQLHYANTLNQLIPLICYSQYEHAWIELESSTSIKIKGRYREIDLVLYYTNNSTQSKDEVFKIVVEMKCYRQKTSLGTNRGAQNIFMKDVHEDLNLLEQYLENDKKIKIAVALVMTDYKSFITQNKNSKAKCRDYDLYHGKQISNVHLTTSTGGHSVNIELKKSYTFNWVEKGNFYFLELEGK